MVTVDNTLELEAPENGTAPKSRIKDASCAAKLVAKLIDANRLRAASETKVKGTLDGNPPLNSEALKASGQSNRCNVNFREAEGLHDAAVTPYYDLFAESPYFCEIRIDDPMQYRRVEKSRVATTEFNELLKQFDQWDFTVQMACCNLVDYGKGFVMWDDADNWQCRWVKQSRVLVPDKAPANLDELEVLVIRESFLLGKLWGKIEDRKTASGAGWKPEAVTRAMTRSVPDTTRTTQAGDDYEYWQSRMRNNDLYESYSSNVVRAAHVLTKEFEGRISHYIVEEIGGGDQKKDDKQEFLYKKIGRFKSFRQVMGALFYDLGDGEWHSVKGLLVKMHPFIEIKNRANCAIVDNMFLNLSVLVKHNNPKDLQGLSMLQIGPLSVLPPGTEPVQWGLAGRMEEGLAVDRHLDNKLQSNIGTYRQTVRREDGNPETATKVMADQSKEAMLSKGAVNRFYAQMDFIYEEMFRRASNPKLRDDKGGPNSMALEFQKRCKERGVTADDLKSVRSVRAYRNIGNGSIFMRQQAITNTGSIVPMLNEQGRQNWLDDAIATFTNHDMVERYNPKDESDPTLNNDRVIAELQIAAAKTGVPPVITPYQNHVVFADKFLAAASQSIQAATQGQAEPAQVVAFVDTIAPATMQHIESIKGDETRKEAYEPLIQTWKKLASATDQLRRQVEQQNAQSEQAMQQQQAMMNDEQMKWRKTESDIERKDRKASVDMELKRRKTEQSLAINDVKTAQTLLQNNLTNDQ